MLDLTVNDFLEQLASDAPAPGGGSASALAGALAASLVDMVANLTKGKEKFAAVEVEMIELNQEATVLRQQLADLIEEDTVAFRQVVAAFKLPKETAAEKNYRQTRIEESMAYAARVPLKTAETALEVLKLAEVGAGKGSPAAVSDAGVAALLAWGAVEGAALNVRINLGSIKDDKTRQDLEDTIQDVVQAAETLAGQIREKVKATLQQDR